jgi:5-methylcytosine-specific restriction endonuclease McrA
VQTRRNGRGGRSDLYAPYGTCRKCGWTGKDWGFKYHGFCTRCHDEWRKAKAEERWARKPPNENITVADGIVITRNVRERLKKQAYRDTPRTRGELLWATRAVLSLLASLGFGCAWFWSLSGHAEYTTIVGACAVATCVTFYVCEWKQAVEAKKRLPKVDARLEELARERQRQIDEARAFYASAEWRLVRDQVIREQGPVCRKCRSHIRTDYDLTVDHIKPRGKFPELALDKSNLQVLCRKCNSAKGATYNEVTEATPLATPLDSTQQKLPPIGQVPTRVSTVASTPLLRTRQETGTRGSVPIPPQRPLPNTPKTAPKQSRGPLTEPPLGASAEWAKPDYLPRPDEQ